MEQLSVPFLSSLLSIIVIDLVLAGDNALVIGMAARNIPPAQQKTAIFWGTAGAVVIRALATLVVVWLLRIPGLQAAGGIALLVIAYKIMAESKQAEQIEAAPTVGGAIRTIIIADAAMGLDNVIAVAGAAQGDFLLVVAGLAFSVPVVVWGSSLFIRLLDRFPALIYAGGGVLAWTAGKMLVSEPLWQPFFAEHALLRTLVILTAVSGALAAGALARHSANS
ncbi:MAG: TerC family protein [Sporomusaceae bacterium]|nr:TerC family protein [Sporomusaceae bacterium]